MKGTYVPTRLHVLIPTQQFYIVGLMMSQRTSEVTKSLNVTESSFTIQCPGITEVAPRKNGFMRLVVLHF